MRFKIGQGFVFGICRNILPFYKLAIILVTASFNTRATNQFGSIPGNHKYNNKYPISWCLQSRPLNKYGLSALSIYVLLPLVNRITANPFKGISSRVSNAFYPQINNLPRSAKKTHYSFCCLLSNRNPVQRTGEGNWFRFFFSIDRDLSVKWANIWWHTFTNTKIRLTYNVDVKKGNRVKFISGRVWTPRHIEKKSYRVWVWELI